MAASHAFEEHTSEVRIRLSAPALPDLFAEAGRALAELQAESVPAPSDPLERVSIEAPDPEALLVAWLDELIFRSESSGRVYSRFLLDRVTGTALEGAIAGAPPETTRTAVKAATFHGLRIERGPDGFRATVVLDV